MAGQLVRWAPANLFSEVQQNVLPGKFSRESISTPPLTGEKALPQGTCLIGVLRHGKSLWNHTYKLDTRLPHGQLISYFLKVCFQKRRVEARLCSPTKKVFQVAAGIYAQGMIRGEYESVKAFLSINTCSTPNLISTGAWLSGENVHFVVYEFLEMIKDSSETCGLAQLVANIHRSSTGLQTKFGFHVPTYHGLLPQKNDWADTWEDFFTAALKFSFELEKDVHGPESELERLYALIFSHVIPRLIRPLETGTQKIKPCLVHGDLWLGNCSIEERTKRPIIFDACAFWGHSECMLPLETNSILCKQSIG